jgi:hypothetical protein
MFPSSLSQNNKGDDQLVRKITDDNLGAFCLPLMSLLSAYDGNRYRTLQQN